MIEKFWKIDFSHVKNCQNSQFLYLFLKWKTKINWLPCRKCRKCWKINLQKYIKIVLSISGIWWILFSFFPRWKIFIFVVWFMFELEGGGEFSMLLFHWFFFFAFIFRSATCVLNVFPCTKSFMWNMFHDPFFLCFWLSFYFLVVSLINKSHTASIKSDP